MNTHFILTILACVVTGLLVMMLERREQARQYSRNLESRQRMVDAFDLLGRAHKAKLKAMGEAAVLSSIAQFELGRRAGQQDKIKDLAHVQSVLAFLASNDDGALRSVRNLTGEGRN